MFDSDYSTFSRLFLLGKEYIGLKTRYLQLTLAEKLSIILSAVILIFVAVLVGAISLFFLSSSLVSLMSEAIGPTWSCAIMGAFYIVLLIIIAAFRKPLIINPVTRFVTRHLL